MQSIQRVWSRVPKHVHTHLLIFVLANVVFTLIALATSSGFWWAFLTVGVWGAGLAIDIGFGAWMASRAEWTDDAARTKLLTPPNPFRDRK